MVEVVLQKPSDSEASPSKGKRKASSSRTPQKKRKREGEGSVSRRTSFDNEAQFASLQRAIKLQASLSSAFPSFVKPMLPSHVTGGFWLGLPKKFCELHLPKADVLIGLEDESGKLYQTKYLFEKMGLSGGWRGFAMAHKLLEMDVLVFHLTEHFKFKVYIVRSQEADELDGALGLLSMKPMNEVDSSVLATVQGNDSENRMLVLGANSSQSEQPLEQKSEDLYLAAHNGIWSAESPLSFEQVTGIENFSIIVHGGLVLDSEFSEHYRAKYYDLCRSQGCFLHENFFKHNCKLMAGMIMETINIADAIKASKVTTSVDSLVTWEITLKSFQSLGLNVDVLLVRLDKLIKLALKLKRYKDARLERLQAKEKLKTLEAEVVEVKKTIQELDEEIAEQDLNPERVETMFEDIANSPW